MKSCQSGFDPANGQICLPKDEKLRDQYTANSKFTRGIDFDGVKKTLFYTFIIAVGLGLFRMTLTHCLPRYSPVIAFVVAIILILVFAILSFATSLVSSLLGGLWSIIFGILLILLALILVFMLCMYSNEIKFQGYMLEYAVKFLNQNPHTFVYIPVFILLHAGLVALILWQHSCFSSYFMGSANFWKLSSSGILDILNILEYIWGLQFLRDSCNNFVIQTIFVFPETLLIGIGPETLHAIKLIKDSSAKTGAALLVDHSSMPSSKFQLYSLNSLFAIQTHAAQSWALCATTLATFSHVSSNWSELTLTLTLI